MDTQEDDLGFEMSPLEQPCPVPSHEHPSLSDPIQSFARQPRHDPHVAISLSPGTAKVAIRICALSLRNLEAIMAERNVHVDHERSKDQWTRSHSPRETSMRSISASGIC
jgi:hypothetical protein